jgi:hypothetical protein
MISAPLVYHAIRLYAGKGFRPIAVPMLVDADISAMLCPEGRAEMFHSPGKVYGASAELSFLQLMREGRLPEGRYQALTPCVRDEPVLDDIHYRVFLKLELIDVEAQAEATCLRAAESFWGSIGVPVERIYTEIGVDLVTSEGLELGSYGVRQFEGRSYAYGTGVAEPRGSIALKKGNRNALV